jgi:hypothetical protein
VSALAFNNGDTLHIFGDRHSVYTRDGQFIRTRAVPEQARVNSAHFLGDGTLILQAMLRTGERIGFPLHAVNLPDTTVRSFGASPDVAFRSNAIADRRVITKADRGSFWAAELSRYRIELWKGSGVLERALERQPDWFKAWDAHAFFAKGPPSQSLPPPMTMAISYDAANQRLWVLVRMADRAWKKPPPQGPKERTSAKDWTSYESTYDTIVEVIDLKAGRLIGSERTDKYLQGFLAPGVATDFVERADGSLSMRIWRLEFTNNSTGRQ